MLICPLSTIQSLANFWMFISQMSGSSIAGVVSPIMIHSMSEVNFQVVISSCFFLMLLFYSYFWYGTIYLIHFHFILVRYISLSSGINYGGSLIHFSWFPIVQKQLWVHFPTNLKYCHYHRLKFLHNYLNKLYAPRLHCFENWMSF
jgi:hypothetical protein